MDLTKSKTQAAYTIAVIVISVLAGAFVGPSLWPATHSVGVQSVSSNVFLITMNDTTADRTFNASYQNLQSNVMVLTIFIGNQNAGAVLYVNQTKAYVHNSTEVGAILAAYNGTSDLHVSELVAFVPPGFWYELNSTSSGGAATIAQWLESIPPTGFGLFIQPAIMTVSKYLFSV
jgi:hypothetical protein